MALVSYRIRCEDCSNSVIIKEEDDYPEDWSVQSLHSNKGQCPDCYMREHSNFIDFEDLDGIGKKAADNLIAAGFETESDIEDASDEELLDVGWIGEKALFSLKERTMQHEPQQRWDDG